LIKVSLEVKGYSIFQTASTTMFEKHVIWKKLGAQTNTFPWYNFRKKEFLIELIKMVLLIVEKGFPCQI